MPRPTRPVRAVAAAFIVAVPVVGCVTAARRPGFEYSDGRARWVAAHAAKLRDIPMPASLPADWASRRDTSLQYDKAARAQLDESALTTRVRADVALGFLPKAALGRGRMLTLSDVGIAGAYDAETKKIVVVNDLEVGGRDDRTLAHEVGHLLDDSRYDLAKLCLAARGNSDRGLAVRALIEGSAMATAADYTLLETYDDFEGSIGGMIASRTTTELESEMGLYGRVSRPGMRLLFATPRHVRERIVFPYARGIQLARHLRVLGGTAAIDEAFANPPLSTEQILHPAKLLESRDDPVEISIGDRWLPKDAAVVVEDTLGEFGLRQLLRTRLRPREAAEGALDWGGDRYRVVAVGGRDVVLLHTEWDTEKAASRFAATLSRVLAARSGFQELWMSELGWCEYPRSDGHVAQVRQRGKAVAFVDGAPAEENWADALLEGDRVRRPARVAPSEPLPWGLLFDGYDEGEEGFVRILGGALASSSWRRAAKSTSILGGLLYERSENCDGARTSLLFGLVSWRTAPRQELTKGRILVSAWGVDSESSAWSILPIVNAPARIRALGHEEDRWGVFNYDQTLKVTFAPDGTPKEGDVIGVEESMVLGLAGSGWFRDTEPDGTPLRSDSFYVLTPFGFSWVSREHGPLGPGYAPKTDSAPATASASAPASRPDEVFRLRPGDVETSSQLQILGDLLFTHETLALVREGRAVGQRTDWSCVLGILASGGVRDDQWWFRDPLIGWAELSRRSYLLFLWGFVPIVVANEPEPGAAPSEAAPAR